METSGPYNMVKKNESVLIFYFSEETNFIQTRY